MLYSVRAILLTLLVGEVISAAARAMILLSSCVIDHQVPVEVVLILDVLFVASDVP